MQYGPDLHLINNVLSKRNCIGLPLDATQRNSSTVWVHLTRIFVIWLLLPTIFDGEHHISFQRKKQHCFLGRGWHIGTVDAFRSKGHGGFDSRSSRHVGTSGKSHSCLWRFGVKFRHSIRAVSRAPLSSSG